MSGNAPSNGHESVLRLLEQDDRGVFGPEGIPGISASMRRKFKTAVLPARTRAFLLIRERRFDEAETLLAQSLPRDECDERDGRYFGIYCGLADVAYAKGDKIAALEWFRSGIEKFPSSIRQNHLVQLSGLGVDVSRWIRSERDDGLTATDAAAVLQNVLETMRARERTGATARAEGSVLQEMGRLEHDGAGRVARSDIRNYLG